MPARKSATIDPWVEMDKLIKVEQEPNGPGWFTVTDFSVRYFYSNSQASKKLKKMAESGLLECWTGRRASDGKVLAKYRLRK